TVQTPMAGNHRIFKTSVAKVYPLYVQEVEKKGHTRAEVDSIICWLTGYQPEQLAKHLQEETDFETFFKEAPQPHPNRVQIKGVICGVRIEDIEDPLMR